MSEEPAKDITEHAELPWFAAIPKSKLRKSRKEGKKWLKNDSTDDEVMQDYMQNMESEEVVAAWTVKYSDGDDSEEEEDSDDFDSDDSDMDDSDLDSDEEEGEDDDDDDDDDLDSEEISDDDDGLSDEGLSGVEESSEEQPKEGEEDAVAPDSEEAFLRTLRQAHLSTVASAGESIHAEFISRAKMQEMLLSQASMIRVAMAYPYNVARLFKEFLAFAQSNKESTFITEPGKKQRIMVKRMAEFFDFGLRDQGRGMKEIYRIRGNEPISMNKSLVREQLKLLEKIEEDSLKRAEFKEKRSKKDKTEMRKGKKDKKEKRMKASSTGWSKDDKPNKRSKVKKGKQKEESRSSKKGKSTRRQVTASASYAQVKIVGETASPISGENAGHQMLMKMGWMPGQALGTSDAGIKEPVQATLRPRQRGLGFDH